MHDLDRRFDLGPPNDELTSLAATLDGLLARIAASRRHEQRFAERGRARAPYSDRQAARTRGARPVRDRGRRRRAAGGGAAHRRRAGRSSHRDHRHAAAGGSPRDRPRLRRGRPRRARARARGVDIHVPGDLPAAEGEPEVVRRALAPLVENARHYASSRVTSSCPPPTATCASPCATTAPASTRPSAAAPSSRACAGPARRRRRRPWAAARSPARAFLRRRRPRRPRPRRLRRARAARGPSSARATRRTTTYAPAASAGATMA